jgi:hypothetical protein
MHLEIFHMASATERDLAYRRAERRAPHLDRLAAERRQARVPVLRGLRGRWRALRAGFFPTAGRAHRGDPVGERPAAALPGFLGDGSQGASAGGRATMGEAPPSPVSF